MAFNLFKRKETDEQYTEKLLDRVDGQAEEDIDGWWFITFDFKKEGRWEHRIFFKCKYTIIAGYLNLTYETVDGPVNFNVRENRYRNLTIHPYDPNR